MYNYGRRSVVASVMKPGFSLVDRILTPLDGLLALMSAKRKGGIKIDRPIFIIGIERSGTTLLYSILANHPDLYWLSRLDSALPGNPCIASLVRRLLSPVSAKSTYIAMPGTIAQSRGMLPPSECLPYWRQIFKWGDEANYLIEDDRFTEADVDDRISRFLHKDLKLRLLWMRRKRLLFKQTAFCLRIRFINAVFPDALFLHIIRDPFLNCVSLVRAKDASQEKFWGVKIPGWRQLVAADKWLQAAIQIRTALEIIEEDIREAGVGERYLRVKYEDIIGSPYEGVGRILNFCCLSWTDTIEEALKGIRKDQNKDRNRMILAKEVTDILSSIAKKYEYIYCFNST